MNDINEFSRDWSKYKKNQTIFACINFPRSTIFSVGIENIANPFHPSILHFSMQSEKNRNKWIGSSHTPITIKKN